MQAVVVKITVAEKPPKQIKKRWIRNV